MPPRQSTEMQGRATFEAISVAEYVDTLVAIPQPGFYARGEPREYPRPGLPGIWRDDHDYQDRTPVSGEGGYYTQGELEALRQCQADYLAGEIDDRYFDRFFSNVEAEISLDSEDLLHWTALAQHYNQNQRNPTRLLDVTTDALVALYFAVSSHPDEDGFVFWATGNCNDLSNLPETETQGGIWLDIMRIRATDGGVDYRPADDTLNFIRPPFPNRRIEAQRGAFLWTRQIDNHHFGRGLIVRVPSTAKPEIMNGLKALNYNADILFPI